MFGYAKIFQQIFDSSIADDWQVRHVFEDLLILANSDGVVDMTHDAISRRTNTPIEIITRAISELEKPDLKSRSEAEGGARLKRLDDHRDWGWWIVNHTHYRDMTTDEQYRSKSRERMRRFRENAKKLDDVTQRNATVTHVTPSRSRKQKAEADTKAEGKEQVRAPAPNSRMAIPDIEEVKLFCAKSGIPESDATALWFKWDGNGWTNGGKPIKKWTSTLISWKNQGYLPSQKGQNGSHKSTKLDRDHPDFYAGMETPK